MKVLKKIDDIRQCRLQNRAGKWGLVPTMGYLHAGHLSLVRKARAENDYVAVSIFLNPKQFEDVQDLRTYPKDLRRDLELLEHEEVDLVWTPAPAEIYPPDYQTYVSVQELAKPLEGAARPGHFRGVATIVAKLFNVFEPQRAYFGQKDAQQLLLIQQMVKDLNFNLQVVACPTVREQDGLAMSSRNARLPAPARKQAICLYEALRLAERMISSGERKAATLRSALSAHIEDYNLARIDYVSIVNPATVDEIERIAGRVLICLAVSVDGVRLIDNLTINIREAQNENV